MIQEGAIYGGIRLIRKIGEGGTAKVYYGQEIVSGEMVAVKMIEKDKVKHFGGLAEIRFLQSLYHPALPHIRKVWEEEQSIFVTMDYVEGISLDKVLEQYGAMSVNQAVDIAKQLCRVLIYLHGFSPPVIYRDLKPANIILQKDGRIKLIDFGAARQYRKWQRHDTMPLGTVGYAAPEQYRGGRQSTIRTDVYCFGTTFYHMLTGHNPGEPPYEIWSVRKWNPKLSPDLERLVKKCTRQQPLLRYKSFDKILKTIEKYERRKYKFK